MALLQSVGLWCRDTQRTSAMRRGFGSDFCDHDSILGRYVLQLFVSAREASAQAVLNVAYQYLFVMSCALILLFLVHTFRSCPQGLGNPTIPMLSGFVELGVRICMALFLPRLIGASSIFFAEVAAWAGAVLLMVIYYYTNIKTIKRGILCSQPHPAAAEKV